MWVALLILLAVLVWVLRDQVWLTRSNCISARRSGLMVIEVRRRVGMLRLPPHVSEFPVPREERSLVHRCLGIVLWHRDISVALPLTACAHLADIRPQDFDGQFPVWLRQSLKSPPPPR
ncbi:hypothetical protein [Variovorax sp. KK3]|uniref:hypothetical protein n=1 Tax=Variovorax sp. KK3 TaxID=1855728 RepID=UPI00097CAE72|nr:hypothetical protein [Variovorax sp. KK3]